VKDSTSLCICYEKGMTGKKKPLLWRIVGGGKVKRSTRGGRPGKRWVCLLKTGGKSIVCTGIPGVHADLGGNWKTGKQLELRWGGNAALMEKSDVTGKPGGALERCEGPRGVGVSLQSLDPSEELITSSERRLGLGEAEGEGGDCDWGLIQT